MADRSFTVITGGKAKSTGGKAKSTGGKKPRCSQEMEIIVETENSPSIAGQVRAIALLLSLPLEPFADLLIETSANPKTRHKAA